jgi:hypothetical protein
MESFTGLYLIVSYQFISILISGCRVQHWKTRHGSVPGGALMPAGHHQLISLLEINLSIMLGKPQENHRKMEVYPAAS